MNLAAPIRPNRATAVARNTAINLTGYLVPLAVAIATIPITVRTLGPDRFGLLSFAWVVLAYSTVFDLGVSRAATKFAAEAIAARDSQQVAQLTWSAAIANTLLGLCGLVLMSLFAPHLVVALNVPADLAQEALASFYVIAVAIPVMLVGAAFRGILEAGHRFDLVNLVVVPSSTLLYVIPAAGAVRGFSIPTILFLILINKLLASTAFAVMAHQISGSPLRLPSIESATLKKLLSFGGWLTVSGVVTSVFAYADRLLIGFFRSVAAVTYYAVPYEIVARLWVVPNAVSAALFPTFSSGRHPGPERAQLYRRAFLSLLLVLHPIVLVLLLFAEEMIGLWIGSDVALRSAAVLRILALGAFANSLAFVPFVLLQATGRPDLTGKLHLAEVVPYLAVTAVMATAFGAIGVALSLALRFIVEACLLFVIADRAVATVSEALGTPEVRISGLVVVLTTTIALLLQYIGTPPILRVLLVVLAAFFSTWLLWRHVLLQNHRSSVLLGVRVRFGGRFDRLGGGPHS